MHGHQVRRRKHGDEPEAERRESAQPPLVRGVSNRAVVQRLAFKGGLLVVPRSYGDRQIPWIQAAGYVDDRPPVEKDPTFSKLVETNPTFSGIVEKALGIDFTAFPPTKGFHDGEIAMAAPAYVKRAPRAPQADADDATKASYEADRLLYDEMVNAVRAAILSPNRVLDVPEERFPAIDDIRAAQRAVLDQDAYLPTENDLPPVGTDLLNVIANPDDPPKDQQSYYTYTCVLIALLKDKGYDATEKLPLAPKVPKNMHKAVYALHDYYVGKRKLQYDDGGARMTIMKEWGYSLRWAGTTKWNDLPAHIELPADDYIVDIGGHTLKLTVHQPITRATRITSITDFFTDHSESDNWALSKTFNENTEVKAIWKKP